MPDISFTVKLEKAVGIDIHKEKIVCGFMGVGIETEVREYQTFTHNLEQIVTDIVGFGIGNAVMESTGIYWIPLHSLLERSGVKVILANPLRVKQIPGKKTDTNDSLWLCKLLINGLVSGSFIPQETVRQLRDLHRQRYQYQGELTRIKSRVLKVLESCNIKLRSLLSNINTKSARNIVTALANGETDMGVLKDMLLGRARKHLPLLEAALTGTITDHTRFMLRLLLDDWQKGELQIKAIEAESNRIIDQHHKESRTLLQQIPGIGPQCATVILSEIGNDISAFPSADHLASWAGLSPGNKQSAGTRFKQPLTKGNKYLRASMVQVAWAAVRSKGTYWHAQFQYISKRLGKKKAIIAIARKMLKLVYRTLKDNMPYEEKGSSWYDEQRQKFILRKLQQEIK